MTLIHHFLEMSATRFPEKPALICGELRESYAQINLRAEHIAAHLSQQGLSKGDRVVLMHDNGLEYVASYYGILKAGGVVVPMNTDLKWESLLPLLMELEPAAVITSARLFDMMQKYDIGSTSVRSFIVSHLSKEPPAFSVRVHALESIMDTASAVTRSEPGTSENDLACIIYTSGSTGKPKGVMLSHGNIVSNTRAICEYLGLTEQDIQMVILPFSYVMGLSLLNTHFAVGGTVVINNTFAYPATVVQQMIEEKVTGFSGVPSTYAYLLHRSPLAARRDQLGSLRYCSQAGGHMPDQVKMDLRKILPEHTQIFIMYGATEASARLSCLDPLRFHDKMGSIGKAISGVTLKIVDEMGHELPPETLGELVAQGPNIMRGYWKDSCATERVLDKNGYHTGDLGYMDKEGFFYIKARKDNLLKVGGYRLNPREIEDAIAATGMVIEVSVFGVPDMMMGNKLVAFATPTKDSYTSDQMLGQCAAHLPRHKIPKVIQLVRSLPKNINGKIDREKLLQMVS